MYSIETLKESRDNLHVQWIKKIYMFFFHFVMCNFKRENNSQNLLNMYLENFS